MRRLGNILWNALILGLAAVGCVEPFQPPLNGDTTNILVVDGFINTNDNSALVHMVKANTLSRSSQFVPETKASVVIESEDGSQFVLTEKGNGDYERKGLVLNTTKKYRVRITRLGGKAYSSNFIELTGAATLDQIGWTPNEDGLTIFVDAHDATGKIRYYKWNYVETYEYHAYYQSLFTFVNGVGIPRSDNYTYTCWKTEPPGNIRIASTANLGEAIVYHHPVKELKAGTFQLSRMYSILVRQRGINEEEYNYWNLLQRTTENLGSLFDPLPSQVTGNIHSESSATEPVLGYFSGGAITEKRIFIDSRDLPSHLRRLPYQNCFLDSVLFTDLPNYKGAQLNLVSTFGPISPIGYTYTILECMDCRTRGGVLTKPSFWP